MVVRPFSCGSRGRVWTGPAPAGRAGSQWLSSVAGAAAELRPGDLAQKRNLMPKMPKIRFGHDFANPKSRFSRLAMTGFLQFKFIKFGRRGSLRVCRTDILHFRSLCRLFFAAVQLVRTNFHHGHLAFSQFWVSRFMVK